MDTITVPYIVPAVTTKQAKEAANENVTRELSKMAIILLSLDNREDKVNKLKELKSSKLFADETLHFLYITGLRERQHFDFMDHLLSKKIPEFTEQVRGNRKQHDYTKDELFYFAAASFFDGGVKSKEMEQFKDSELERHYRHEPHHPEFEKFNDAECSEIDILEMAIDRLARNVQFGNGLVNLDVLRNFMPTFPRGDNNAKRELLWKYCEKYQSVVQNAFHEMFPDTRLWSQQS